MVLERLVKHHSIQNGKLYKNNRNMPKLDIHPNWFEKAPIFCDGKPLCFIGSTKKELQVDVWLINHPFYTESQTIIDSEGRVERFMKKYGLDLNN